MLIPLAALILVAGTGAPGGVCPSETTVAEELQRLGALAAVTQLGRAEVAMDGASLSVVMLDHHGAVLGTRRVEAPAECQARAAVAAVLLAAWAGQWAKTDLPAERASAPGPAFQGTDAPERPSSTTKPADPLPDESPSKTPAVESAGPTATGEAPEATGAPSLPAQASLPAQDTPPAPSSQGLLRSLAVDVALVGSGVHDTDAGAGAWAAQLAARGRTIFLMGLAENVGARDRSLGAGSAGYGSWRFGLGVGARWSGSLTFVEAALLAELARYALQGKDLTPTHQAVAWAPLADLRLCAGLQLGRFAPFIYVGANTSLMSEQLVLDDAPDSVRLARLNLAAGLGISFRLKKHPPR